VALLGHVARLTLHTADVEATAGILGAVGFDGVTDEQGTIRCSDGQILMQIEAGKAGSVSLTYHAPSLQSVGDRLTAAGIAYSGNKTESLVVEGPGRLSLRVMVATPSDIEDRSGEDNHVLGFLDAIVIPVEDAAAAAVWAQKCGFFIIEASRDGASMVDVTDGLVKLSFREQVLRAPYLHYTADIDRDWIESVTGVLGTSCRVVNDGTVELAQITVADALVIMVTADEF
jgi:hypothetical protein